MNNLIYVYCITNKPPEFGPDLQAIGLEYISINDLFVVVKRVSEDEFSEENFKKNLSDLPWVDLNARQHISVICQIMETNTVIPFKFGTIYHAESGLKKFVSDYSKTLDENLEQLNGKEEWAVKVYCDRKALSQQIDELSAEAAALEKQIMASSPGKAFILKRKKDELIKNEMDRICKIYGQKYFEEFRTLSDSHSLNNLLPNEHTGREDTMILNATFLMCKVKVADMNLKIHTLGKRDADTGFKIEPTGPWPPFSFIAINEKK